MHARTSTLNHVTMCNARTQLEHRILQVFEQKVELAATLITDALVRVMHSQKVQF